MHAGELPELRRRTNSMFRLLATFLRITEELAVIETVAASARRLALQAALGVAAALLATVAAGCLVAAAWIWALHRIGPVGAPLLVALLLAMGCGALVLIMNAAWRRPTTRRPRQVLHAAEREALAPMRLLSAAARGFLLGLAGQDAPRG
jgi:hypothetical protein